MTAEMHLLSDRKAAVRLWRITSLTTEVGFEQGSFSLETRQADSMHREIIVRNRREKTSGRDIPDISRHS
jgi:hypothetical protein